MPNLMVTSFAVLRNQAQNIIAPPLSAEASLTKRVQVEHEQEDAFIPSGLSESRIEGIEKLWPARTTAFKRFTEPSSVASSATSR